jgi:hypothetical protein
MEKPANDDKYAEIIRQANAVIEAYLQKKTGVFETLFEAERIVEDKELQLAFEDFDKANREFMKDYSGQVRRLGGVLALPLIEELDQLDARKKAGTTDVTELFRVQKELTFKAIEMATRLAEDSPGFNRPGEGNQSYDPLEVSVVLVSLVGRRLGDKDNLTGVGWTTFLNGLAGTDITLKEQVQSGEEYVKGLVPPKP